MASAIAKEKRLLLKKQVLSIAADLKKTDMNDLFRYICTDIGNGYHEVLYIASVHGRLWNNISKHMQGGIIVLYKLPSESNGMR